MSISFALPETAVRTLYESPLTQRYASKEMGAIWSPAMKFGTWRRLWLALATAQREAGLDISDAQLAEMAANLDLNEEDFTVAAAKEVELRHDVMAHIHAFGARCPAAMPIIHLGATSMYVNDNTDLIILRNALKLVHRRLLRLIEGLRGFCDAQKATPTLGFTHYQPAQLVTIGKRASLWLQDFALDERALARAIEDLPFRGCVGTTGTQASYLALFDGDHAKVETLSRRIAEICGFDAAALLPVCGQTYTRKFDYFLLATLSGIAQSAHKMCTDVRLLANLKELEEPFGKKQVGSSAMAYKRNPMRSERVCALARIVMSLSANAANTHANQWLERTLDDSANRRIALPEAFLAIDVLLRTAADVAGGLVVYPQVVNAHVMAELPFMATEEILMACVKAGGDRQVLHEAIREHSMAAARVVKNEGGKNDLIERLLTDELFAVVHASLVDILQPERFVGRCAEQVDAYLASYIDPLLARHAVTLAAKGSDQMRV